MEDKKNEYEDWGYITAQEWFENWDWLYDDEPKTNRDIYDEDGSPAICLFRERANDYVLNIVCSESENQDAKTYSSDEFSLLCEAFWTGFEKLWLEKKGTPLFNE